jgi:hypothetical protein
MRGRTAAATRMLGSAAIIAAGGALATDVAPGDHPTHLMVLGAVVVVVAALRQFGCRAVTALPTVAAALAAQPMLHMAAELARPHAAGPDHADPLQHLLLTEAPTAGVQIAVPALAIVAVTIGAHLLHLLIDAVRRPLSTSYTPRGRSDVLVPVRARRRGSMLHWCGWMLQAARRGPPSGNPAS